MLRLSLSTFVMCIDYYYYFINIMVGTFQPVKNHVLHMYSTFGQCSVLNYWI